MTQNSYRIKRGCLHNLRVTASNPTSQDVVPEGLVLPEGMMAAADFAPYEQVIVTKIGGSNWVNRMYTFVLPGTGDEVEARGSIAHLLGPGDVCCMIAGSYLDQAQYDRYVGDGYDVPTIDVRLYPEEETVNDLSKAKVVLEYGAETRRVEALSPAVVERRRELPRVVLSNLLSGLRIEEVERRGCIEMSAELPIEYMRRAGLCPNQSIFVYNASRGGTSAESYVVPSLTKRTVGISGALSAVADIGDIVSEAAYVTNTDGLTPTICNLHHEPALG